MVRRFKCVDFGYVAISSYNILKFVAFFDVFDYPVDDLLVPVFWMYTLWIGKTPAVPMLLYVGFCQVSGTCGSLC